MRPLLHIKLTPSTEELAMIDGYQLSTLPRFIGTELGVTEWQPIAQQRIQAFADCTGDQQWIHTDVERCRRESPFGAPIAHGMLSLSLIARMVMDAGAIPPDASRAINAGIDNVRFRAPVRADSRVRGRIRLASAEPKSEGRVLAIVSAVLEVDNERDPALTADVAIMLAP
jgi:acyl dehydratase